MKTAIVGTGNIAQVHARETMALGHQVSLVVGHTPKSAEEFGAQFGCKNFSEKLTPTLLRDIDCVQICTPPHLHAEMVKLCLREGKHVICEKPLSLSPDEARSLSRLAEESGVVATVTFNNRYYESIGRIRKAVAAEDFGLPLFLHGHYFQEFHMLPAPYSWRYDAAKGERLRAVTEIGSHWVDLLRYLTGREVEAVSAVFVHARPERYLRDGVMYPKGEAKEKIWVDSEDAALVTLRLEGSIPVSAVFSEVSPGRSNDLSLEITSDSGSVSWCSQRPYEAVYGKRGQGMTTQTNAFGGSFSQSFQDYFREAFICMERGRETDRLPTFLDGAKSALICNSIGRSAAAGGIWIDVKEDTCGEQG